MRFYLNASDVAAAAGMNKYVSPKDIMSKLGYIPKIADVYDQIPTEVAKALGSKSGSAKQAVLQLITQSGEIVDKKQIINKVVNACKDQRIKEVEKELKDTIQPNMSSNQEVIRIEKEKELSLAKKGLNVKGKLIVNPNDLKLEVTSVINKYSGRRDESSITSLYEQQYDILVTNRNEKMYYMCVTIGSHTFKIGGKIDGLQDGGQKLVEVKRRTNYLFQWIPLREKIQMEVYMRMPLLDLNESVLVQYHKKSNRLTATDYLRNDKLWLKVINGLDKFASTVVTEKLSEEK